MQTQRNRRINNNRGSVLVSAYILIIMLLGFGAAFVISSINENMVAERQKRTAIALGLAEAGLERAFYDLRQDFVGASTPSWSDGTINGMALGPDTSGFYAISYSSTNLNGGSYSVQLKNVAGATDQIWVKSTGTYGDARQVIQAYAKMINTSIWNNAIFAGAGAAGAMVNGNVNIRGSVHILSSGISSTDTVISMGGTAELVGNNYNGLAASLAAKVPALPTTVYGGQTVSTLNAKLRVKRGIVALSGSATVGEVNDTGNTVKETVDGSYVTNGFGGSQGTGNVYSDNGWSNAYDLGDEVAFPSLSNAYGGYSSYQDYLYANALVISDATKLTQLAGITPNSNFSYSNAKGSINMDGAGNMTVSGIVYVDGGGFVTAKSGSNKTITYTGAGSIFSTGNIQINTDLITSGNNSFPANIIGFMTPGIIGMNEASIDVMGMFYAETKIQVQKQTDILGTLVSNYFDMGTNVPSIFQVPTSASALPPGMIGGNAGTWQLNVVAWQEV